MKKPELIIALIAVTIFVMYCTKPNQAATAPVESPVIVTEKDVNQLADDLDLHTNQTRIIILAPEDLRQDQEPAPASGFTIEMQYMAPQLSPMIQHPLPRKLKSMPRPPGNPR